jgi:hypothetical protein
MREWTFLHAKHGVPENWGKEYKQHARRLSIRAIVGCPQGLPTIVNYPSFGVS